MKRIKRTCTFPKDIGFRILRRNERMQANDMFNYTNPQSHSADWWQVIGRDAGKLHYNNNSGVHWTVIRPL